jgi:hypothetical protein
MASCAKPFVPPRGSEQRLRDILAAIDKIRRYTAGMDFATFAGDERTIDAVIRNFTVIGEAANHLPDELVSHQPGVPWAEMRGMRNVVIHEYFGVSLAILWETIQHDLPEAERSLGELLPP